MIKTEAVHTRTCDLCSRDMGRVFGRIENALERGDKRPIGNFLPVEWGGARKIPLNVRLTIGPAPEDGAVGPEEQRPDVCRSCLREVFEMFSERLKAGKTVVGAPE